MDLKLEMLNLGLVYREEKFRVTRSEDLSCV